MSNHWPYSAMIQTHCRINMHQHKILLDKSTSVFFDIIIILMRIEHNTGCFILYAQDVITRPKILITL